MSTHNLFKRTLQAYTQLPIDTLPNNLDGIVHMLLEYIEFYKTLIDTSRQGIESCDDGITDAAAYGVFTHQSSYIPTLTKGTK